MQKYLVAVAVGVLATTNLLAGPVDVPSPDGQVVASFEMENGELSYSVSKVRTLIVGSSRVEIFASAKMAVVEQSIRDNDSSWTRVYGQFSSIRDRHRELTLTLTADGAPVTLLCRAFDTGIGFRFVLSQESQGRDLSFSTGYNVLNNAATHSGQRGAKVDSLAKAMRVSVPLVTERKDGLHVALLESGLYSATGFESMRIRYSAVEKGLVAASSAVSIGEMPKEEKQ